MNDSGDGEDRITRIDMSPRYRFLKGLREKRDGDAMDDDFPKATTIEPWEVRVVLTALDRDLRETIDRADGRDDGLVQYIKILSGVILKLEEANGGAVE